MSEQLLDVLKAQRRRRRMGFWLGFAAIFLVGGLWAQLSKDPLGPDFLRDEAVFEQEVPAIEIAPVDRPADVAEEDTTTTVTEPPVTTVPPTTAADTAPPTTTPQTSGPTSTEAP